MTDGQTPTVAFLVDWHAAELAAVEHMRSLGFIDAQATAPGADGGIDAESSEAAAQVKFYANPIGRPEIQRLRGAAHEYRLALFYSTGGYTKEAVTYANDAGVSLFVMDAYGSCTPASDFADLLVAPDQVGARRARLEELQTFRYRLAAVAVDSNLTLCQQFARKFKLAAGDAEVFNHVMSGVRREVDRFGAAIESRSFADADIAFGEIQTRMSLLSYIGSPILCTQYVDIEEAIAEGWRLDAEVQDHILERAAAGVRELRQLLETAFDGWSEGTLGFSTDNLVESQTSRSAGALSVAERDLSILTPQLLRELKISVVVGVERARQQAEAGFERIIRLLSNANLEEGTRGMVAYMLRAERIANRVVAQLEASEH